MFEKKKTDWFAIVLRLRVCHMSIHVCLHKIVAPASSGPSKNRTRFASPSAACSFKLLAIRCCALDRSIHRSLRLIYLFSFRFFLLLLHIYPAFLCILMLEKCARHAISIKMSVIVARKCLGEYLSVCERFKSTKKEKLLFMRNRSICRQSTPK